MPWSTTRPAGTQAKYRTPEHRRERARLERMMQAQAYLECAQPVCVMGDRTIHRDQRWCAGHDDTGTVYIGPVHARCNVVDAAVRANRRSRGRALRRWVL